MTVHEAIKYLRMATDEADRYSDVYVEMCNMSIEALEEVEQYRALGTVEELKEAREKQKTRREWYQKGYQDGLNADKWIPCEERLPKILQWVLIQTTHGDMDVVRYLGETECCGNDFYHKIHPRMVIAWQPLPQPYKEEGAE